MPPKRTYNNDSDDSESTATSSNESDDDVPVSKSSNKPTGTAGGGGGPAGGRSVANRPHDEEFDVDGNHVTKTPPNNALQKPTSVQATITPASKSSSGGNMLRNNPNDETFDVEDDERPVKTPPRGGARPAPASGAAGGAAGGAGAGGGRGSLRNNPHDEFEEIDDDDHTMTPRQGGGGPAAGAKPGALSQHSLQQGGGGGPGGSRQIRNDHHDEAIDLSASPTSTNGVGTPPSTHKQQPQQVKGKMSMVPRDEPDSSSEDDSHDHAPIKQPAGGLPPTATGAAAAASAKPNPAPEYNPADYSSINQRASREMQDLFACIAAYQPLSQELPSKLRPFIPDFIPSVGDLDPFCKIPRPDGRPDNLGLHVVDEPSSTQSNPAVIKIWLNYIARSHVPSLFVESVEDAASKPNVIDKWVQDLKTLQKPLPSVTYTKPMPEIESLLQVWPPEFEELLNSDLQFPPSQIDLDIDQYVRVMCAILDIPTYGSVIESLHVIFTLYMEFRANQHFQHA